MPSRNTAACVVMDAQWTGAHNKEYTLKLRRADCPESEGYHVKVSVNGLGKLGCDQPWDLPFPGFGRGVVCTKRFESNAQQRAHCKAVHDLELFACPFEACDHINVDGSNLDKHKRSCKHNPDPEAERVYQCELCPYSSGRSDNLRRHQKKCRGQPRQQSEEVAAVAEQPLPEVAYPPEGQGFVDGLAVNAVFTNEPPVTGELPVIGELPVTGQLPVTYNGAFTIQWAINQSPQQPWQYASSGPSTTIDPRLLVRNGRPVEMEDDSLTVPEWPPVEVENEGVSIPDQPTYDLQTTEFIPEPITEDYHRFWNEMVVEMEADGTIVDPQPTAPATPPAKRRRSD